MADTLTAIVSSIGASVATSGALIWISKTWISERIKGAIQHEYDQKLEIHKAQLQRESDREIERLRADLQIMASERSIRLSHAFDKTAEVISTLWGKLLELHQIVTNYVIRMDQTLEQNAGRLKAVTDSGGEFKNYFIRHKIYIPRATADRVDEFSHRLTKLTEKFSLVVHQERLMSNPQSDQWGTILTELSDEVSPILRLLEDDFRGVLGLDADLKPLHAPKESELKKPDKKSL